MDLRWSGLPGHNLASELYAAGQISEISEISERGVVIMVPSVHADGTFEISIGYAIGTKSIVGSTEKA